MCNGSVIQSVQINSTHVGQFVKTGKQFVEGFHQFRRRTSGGYGGESHDVSKKYAVMHENYLMGYGQSSWK